MRPLNQATMESIRDCIAENTCYDGECLTLRSIALRTGIPYQTVGYYLKKMIESGELETDGRYGYQFSSRKPKLHRSYRVIEMVGRIPCGQLNIAEDDIHEYMQFPEEMFGSGDYFALTAHGESMIDAGIEPGDIVIVRRQNTAEPGQIVVMLSTEFTDSGVTLKRYYPEPEKHRIRLHPENSSMEDIYITEGVIQGVAERAVRVSKLT